MYRTKSLKNSWEKLKKSNRLVTVKRQKISFLDKVWSFFPSCRNWPIYMIYPILTSSTSAKSFLQRFRIINIIFISVEFLVLHPSLHFFQNSHCFVACEAINCRQMVATVGSIELSFNLPLTIIIGPRRLPLTVNYERNISKATADPTVALFYIATGQHRLNVYKICHFVAVLLQKFKNSSSC